MEGQEMLKSKLMVVLLICVVYFCGTFCMLNGDVCRFYADYYLLNNRIISQQEERQFSAVIIREPLVFFNQYSFDKEYQHIHFLGFGEVEENGRWSNGDMAKIAFMMPKLYSNVIVKLAVRPYISQHNPKISGKVFVNGKEKAEWIFEQGKKHPQTELELSQKDLDKDNRVEIYFQLYGYVSPKKIGYGEDTRKLGIFISNLEVTPKID